MPARRGAVTTLSVLILLIACGGTKTFSAGQIHSIMLRERDMSSGLTLVPQSTGTQTVDQLVGQNSAGKAKLLAFEFQGAETAVFANQSALNASSNATPPPDAEYIASIAIEFKTANDAKKAFAYQLQNDAPKWSKITNFAAPKFGEQTVAYEGTYKGETIPTYQILWREGNTDFGVIISGGPQTTASDATLKSLVRVMHERAQKA
jgi:hypothetical protein